MGFNSSRSGFSAHSFSNAAPTATLPFMDRFTNASPNGGEAVKPMYQRSVESNINTSGEASPVKAAFHDEPSRVNLTGLIVQAKPANASRTVGQVVVSVGRVIDRILAEPSAASFQPAKLVNQRPTIGQLNGS
jgi:hypothetical protein